MNSQKVITKEEYDRLKYRRQLLAIDYRDSASLANSARLMDYIREIDVQLNAYEDTLVKVKVLSYQGTVNPILGSGTEPLQGDYVTIIEDSSVCRVYLKNAKDAVVSEIDINTKGLRKLIVDAVTYFYDRSKVFEKLVEFGVLKA